MPSGRTHDTVTFLLAVPAFAATYAATSRTWPGFVVTAAFVFGGLMFGPDLDTVSKQHSRWLFLSFLWFPYRHFFKHRSRFTHGLVFGALLRVIYFLGVLTLAAYLMAFAWNGIAGDTTPDVRAFAETWRMISGLVRSYGGENFLVLVFLGMWTGAASHTITDIAGSFIKTGRVGKIL